MRKTAFIVTVAKLEQPARVESHVDESVLCMLDARYEEALHPTLKCASDGFTDCENGSTGMVPEEIPGGKQWRI